MRIAEKKNMGIEGYNENKLTNAKKIKSDWY